MSRTVTAQLVALALIVVVLVLEICWPDTVRRVTSVIGYAVYSVTLEFSTFIRTIGMPR
ncbi:hypothetical protein LQ327_33315 [Actinomycetospora endophytica]|uniref:Uncharacterized protein n=1 Tax=Actinomycetospora endophytica TaxID=2291215 RepID=A0ABS8PJ04_9PSEU|nr:hypothetical protein [Actinomycetospora endophytica]MCD2198256.1 hypothetical protein [Actinomycetospora endophytica]